VSGRGGVGFLAAAALILATCVSAGGCAVSVAREKLHFGEAWQSFSAQAGSAAQAAPRATEAPPAPDPEWDRAFEKVPRARAAAKRAARLLKEEAPSRSEVRGLIDDLEEIEREVQQQADRDPVVIAKLRAQIAEMRKRMEAKLLAISRIEPAFDITSRGKVRVAVVKIGEGVETIRREEMLLWRRFLSEAGFSKDTVFSSTPLAGASPSAADLRVAGARLGANAVLAYTTSAATSASPFGESAAVLSFAKCMVVDVRTEYLYLNAEGECRRRRVSLPFTVCSLCLEAECLGEAVGALRGEILHELKRIEKTEAREER
jgi:hypothetical protein